MNEEKVGKTSICIAGCHTGVPDGCVDDWGDIWQSVPCVIGQNVVSNESGIILQGASRLERHI